MKTNAAGSTLRAEEQAALWAARLDGSALADAERAELDTWLAESPSHHALLAEYTELSADLDLLLTPLATRGPVADAVADARAAKPAPRPRAKLVWLSSLGLAAAAAIAVVVWTRVSPGSTQELATTTGHRRAFTLADGTEIELNAHTRLLVTASRGERRVRMDDGEAFFHVAKDASRPFIVETPAGSVRVTGTKFDVRLDPTAPFDVTVVEGSVQVRPADSRGGYSSEPIKLGPGDHVSSHADGIVLQSLSRKAVDDLLAWRQGQVVFNGGMPLREALAYFARYHGREITATPAAGNLRIGGRFSLDDPDAFFTGLEKVLDVRVNHLSSGAVQVDVRSHP